MDKTSYYEEVKRFGEKCGLPQDEALDFASWAWIKSCGARPNTSTHYYRLKYLLKDYRRHLDGRPRDKSFSFKQAITRAERLNENTTGIQDDLDQARRLSELLCGLDERRRVIMVLLSKWGLSFQEIAEAFGCSVREIQDLGTSLETIDFDIHR